MLTRNVLYYSSIPQISIVMCKQVLHVHLYMSSFFTDQSGVLCQYQNNPFLLHLEWVQSVAVQGAAQAEEWMTAKEVAVEVWPRGEGQKTVWAYFRGIV